MSLTPETGSGVAGADTYVTLAEARAYAAKRGLSFPASPDGDAAGEAALVNACDYLETLDWRGTKTEGDGPLAWPRTDVVLDDGTEIAADEIPQKLKDAQCQLAVEAAAGTDLQPSGTGQEVIREKVDVLEVEYAPGSGGTVTPQFNKAMAMLAPYLESGGGFGITVERI